MLSHEFHLEVASDAYFGKGTDNAFKVVGRKTICA